MRKLNEKPYQFLKSIFGEEFQNAEFQNGEHKK